MPKVLRIINRFNLGGITYNVSYLSKFLPAEYETLLVGGPAEPGEESSLFIPRQMGLQPVVLEEMRRSVNPFSDLRAFMKLRAIIREFKPDIVHTHASKAGALGRLAAFSCGVPVVVHTFHGHVFHGYFNPLKTRLVMMAERFLARWTDAIVAISAKQLAELTETYRISSREQTQLISLGFDLSKYRTEQDYKRKRFRTAFRLGDDVLAIGIIGRLVPIKNHFLFIDALHHVAQKSDRKLIGLIIGDGELRQKLEHYARQNFNGEEKILFTGWIKEADLALAGLDLVCLTSRNEGTPVSLIEAQAAGRYIVSTNVGGIEDILHPGSGLLSDPLDPQEFHENLLRAVCQFDLLAKDAGSGSDSVVERFSYIRLCADMEKLYKKLLAPVRG